MADDYLLRTIPSGTDDGTTLSRVGISRCDDIVAGKINVRGEQVIPHPLQWLQASSTALPVSTAGFYPNDATSITSAGAASAAAAAGSLTLAAGSPDWDITGWLLCMLSGGAGVPGQIRRVIAYNTSTKVATIDRNWDTTPATNDQYTIGFDVSRRTWIVFKAECEGTAAQSPSLSVVPFYLDYPRDPPTSGADQGRLGLDGVKRAPRFAPGAELVMDNFDFQGNTVVANYYHMRVRSDQCVGVLAKVRLHAVPGSSKKCALFVGAV